MKKSKFSLAFLLLILSLSFSLTFINFSLAQTLNTSLDEINYGNSLIRIFSENKAGFIDTTGTLVIPAKFANAFNFSEGLAPARITGKYGFINTKGDFVIEPKYDYAESFKNGAAIIYKDSIAGLLYSNGTEIFFPDYRTIKFISSTKAIVTTHSGSKGFININGELLSDTIYADMGDIEKGIASIYRYKTPVTGRDRNYEKAVIDTNLNFVVPFGKYLYVSDSQKGFIRVTEFPEYSTINYDCILNSAGKTILRKSTDEMNGRDTYYFPLSDSIFMVQYFRMDSAGNSSDYYGILNTKTDSVIKNENWSWMNPLTPDFFIVRRRDGRKDILINHRGETVIDTSLYDSFNYPGENSKYISLRKNDLNAVYDVTGKEIAPFQEKFIGVLQNDHAGKPFRKLFFYTTDYDTIVNAYRGIILDTNLNTKFIFPRSDMTIIAGENGFICAYDSNFYYCLNPNAELIYKSNLYGKKSFVNIDFQKEMNYRSSPVSGKRTISTKNIERNESGILFFINKDESVLYQRRYAGLPLYVVNKRDEAISLGSIEFRHVILQAKDKDGKWKYIEGQFYMFFDLSLDRQMLNENQFHRSAIPVFEGDFKTKLRAELTISDPDNLKRRISIYSNEIDCRINLSQFWRKLGDFNYDLANPYLRIINP